MRVFMSQAFSLYEELSVRRNLWLHARLYRMPAPAAAQAVERALEELDLRAHADEGQQDRAENHLQAAQPEDLPTQAP